MSKAAGSSGNPSKQQGQRLHPSSSYGEPIVLDDDSDSSNSSDGHPLHQPPPPKGRKLDETTSQSSTEPASASESSSMRTSPGTSTQKRPRAENEQDEQKGKEEKRAAGKTSSATKDPPESQSVIDLCDGSSSSSSCSTPMPTTAQTAPQDQTSPTSSSESVPETIAIPQHERVETSKSQEDPANPCSNQTETVKKDYSQMDMCVCWSCEVPLRSGVNTLSNDVCTVAYDVNEGADPFVWHVHSHPLLRVTTCSVCFDKANALEDDVQELELEDDAERGNIDTCCWCNGDNVNDDEGGTYDLIMCDKCPRAFCQRCVERAYGFGEEGQKAVQDLISSDAEWACLHCQPTECLKSMQAYLSKQMSHSVDSHERDRGTQTVEDLLKELAAAEAMIEEAESEISNLENDDYANKKRDEIVMELTEMNKNVKSFDDDDVNAGAIIYVANLEIETLKERWHCQHERTVDAIGKIQEALEDKGIDLRQVYREIKREPTLDPGETPEWVEAADKALDKRERKMGADGFRGEESNYRDIEDIPVSDLQGIEEINTTEGAKRIMQDISLRDHTSNQWGTKNLSERDIQNFIEKADPSDHQNLSELNLKVRRKTKKDDMEEDKRDVEESLVMNNDGVKICCRKRVKRKRPTQITPMEATLNSTSSTSLPLSVMNRKRRRIDLQSIQPSTPYQNSDLILSPATVSSGKVTRKAISVVKPLADILKPHQEEGVKFMWKHIYDDRSTAPSSVGEDPMPEVRGCILSHHMGLGKSLQLVVIVHTLLTNPSLRSGNQTCERALLAVPVNTIKNWENEFDIWVKKKDVPDLNVIVLRTNSNAGATRKNTLSRWIDNGGVLICPFKTFGMMCAEASSSQPKDVIMQNLYRKAFLKPGPDIVVCDEGHMMLNNQNTMICKALMSMDTKLRISLTGTPLQNNLKEYFTMANWIKPGCLGAESNYERKYCNPIQNSLNTDSSESEIAKGEELLKELDEKLSFIHRCNHQVLAKDLPPLQQVVIHVRQTKMQTKLYKRFKKETESSGKNNFLEQYQKLFPVNNHPACLLFRHKSTSESNQKEILNTSVDSLDKATSFEMLETKGSTVESETEQQKCVDLQSMPQRSRKSSIDEDNEASIDDFWWKSVYSDNEKMMKVSNGGKVVLLLEIIAHADLIGDKVIVFSQCLKTLDFIESVLNLPNWGNHVKAIENLMDGKKIGAWQKNVEYLRIDGSTSATERGDLVNRFNDSSLLDMPEMMNEETTTSNSKVFLISSKAGGVGINLTAANRVVLFDSSWNPATDLQAIHRTYRYGQQKSVYTYRLLTEGTMEEKVYSRGVNKKNLAGRVLDQRSFERNFSSEELNHVMQIDTWVQCDRCEKWRMVHPSMDTSDLPDKWYCEMNISDKERSNCDAEEMGVEFYRDFFSAPMNQTSAQCTTVPKSSSLMNKESPSKQSEDDKVEATKRDVILSELVELIGGEKATNAVDTSRKKSKTLISKYYFQDDC